jgi:hypothetical protein
MSGRGKRKMGGCQLMALVVAEGVAVIAAIVAITGTFWLGAGPLLLFHVSRFRVFLRVSRANLTSPRPASRRADPNVTANGPVLPGVSNAGLWRVCYDAPVIPATLVDGNQSFDALLVELSENPTAPAPALADDAVVDAQATASDAPRRAGAASVEGDRVVNASKVTADIRRDFAENLPFTRDSAEGCTRDMSLYDGIWDKDFHGRLQATRALTMIFMLCGVLKVFSVIFSTIFCEARGGAGITTLVQVLAGWAGWLVFLWILLDIAGATGAQRAAAERGVFIDTGAADDVRNYWGHSFWLFLAATLASTFGALFAC